MSDRDEVDGYAQLAGMTLYETGILLHEVETERDRLRETLREIRKLCAELPDSHTPNMVVALVDDELQKAGDE